MTTPDPGRTPTATEPVRLAIIDAGVSSPSSSLLLATRIADRTGRLLAEHGRSLSVQRVDLKALSGEIARALVAGEPAGALLEAVRGLAGIDAVIVTTPAYKAGVSGLLKSFADVIDDDLLIAVPTVIAVTGGTARHSLVADDHLRPLLAYLRALVTPTSVYAAPEDWGDAGLGARVNRAAFELSALIRSGVRETIAEGAWGGYRHTWGSPARAGAGLGVDVDTDLMRLAAGGGAR